MSIYQICMKKKIMNSETVNIETKCEYWIMNSETTYPQTIIQFFRIFKNLLFRVSMYSSMVYQSKF